MIIFFQAQNNSSAEIIINESDIDYVFQSINLYSNYIQKSLG